MFYNHGSSRHGCCLAAESNVACLGCYKLFHWKCEQYIVDDHCSECCIANDEFELRIEHFIEHQLACEMQ